MDHNIKQRAERRLRAFYTNIYANIYVLHQLFLRQVTVFRG